MGTITRNVSDIPADDLPAFEHLLGAPLRPSQQVIVQVVDRESKEQEPPPDVEEARLQEWCNVYEGLTDEEIDRLEDGFERLNLRPEKS